MERRGTIRRVVVIASALVVMFALGISSAGARGAARTGLPARTPSVDGNRVLLVGDSLLWQSIGPVTTTLRADGWEPTITAAPGTTIGAWVEKMSTLVADARPDVVVVELGTNNCVAECPHIDAVVDQLMRRIPRTTPVIWLNVQAQPTYPAHPESVNDALAAARARWSNLTLADLSARFRNHPEWHIPDGLHLSAAGSEELGHFVAEALHSARGHS
jgi:lysophospholipase L1-like esterase